MKQTPVIVILVKNFALRGQLQAPFSYNACLGFRCPKSIYFLPLNVYHDPFAACEVDQTLATHSAIEEIFWIKGLYKQSNIQANKINIY